MEQSFLLYKCVIILGKTEAVSNHCTMKVCTCMYVGHNKFSVALSTTFNNISKGFFIVVIKYKLLSPEFPMMNDIAPSSVLSTNLIHVKNQQTLTF
jgi:hypothetical protein